MPTYRVICQDDALKESPEHFAVVDFKVLPRPADQIQLDKGMGTATVVSVFHPRGGGEPCLIVSPGVKDRYLKASDPEHLG